MVYLDGTTEVMTSKIIAEKFLSQVDNEGHCHMVLDEIIDHRCDGTQISLEEGYYTARSGHKTWKRTTRGWQVYVQWKDRSGDWVAMKDIKYSY